MNVSSGAATSYATDALGSVVGVLNSSGAVTGSYGYDPYGNTAASGTGTPLQFTGRENDGVYYYYRARYYDPATARFLSEDPLNIGGGANLYGYAYGDPVSNTDPTGEIVPIVTGGIGAVIGFGGNVVAQLLMNGGNADCVCWRDALVAGGIGAAAGAAAPFVATSWLGAITLGSAANTAQYEVTQAVHGEDPTAFGAAWSAATGAFGGWIGGRFVRLSLPFNTRSPWLDSVIAQQLNTRASINANVTLSTLTRNLAGGVVTGIEPPSVGSGCGRH